MDAHLAEREEVVSLVLGLELVDEGDFAELLLLVVGLALDAAQVQVAVLLGALQLGLQPQAPVFRQLRLRSLHLTHLQHHITTSLQRLLLPKIASFQKLTTK